MELGRGRRWIEEEEKEAGDGDRLGCRVGDPTVITSLLTRSGRAFGRAGAGLQHQQDRLAEHRLAAHRLAGAATAAVGRQLPKGGVFVVVENPATALSPIARPPIPLLPQRNTLPPVFVGGGSGGGGVWTNAGKSPISAYMRYLQNSIAEMGQSRPATPPPSFGLLPTPPLATATSPVVASPAVQFGAPSPNNFLELLYVTTE